MKQTAKALKEFVGGFGIPAYATNSVPDDVDLPYLTYPIVEPEWGKKASFYIYGWYRTTSYSDMLNMCDQIIREIGEGISISMQDGYIVLRPETPLVQFMDDEDAKAFYINLSLNSFHVPGV